MSCGTGRSDRGYLLALFVACLIACGPSVVPDVPLPEAPQRICSVSLAGDELLALLVEPERVACVSSMADDGESSNVASAYPEAIPRLAAHVEPVLSARPDLVLAAPWNQMDFLRLIRSSGVPLLMLDAGNDLAHIRQQLIDVGSKLGASARAQEEASRFDRRLERVRAAVADSPRPRVLSFSHLIVAGVDTSVDALIEAAGGANAARELDLSGHQKVSIERILTLDPDVLLLGFDAGQGPEAVLAAYPQLALTRAAQEERIVLMPPRLLTTVTPFIADGIEQLAFELHGVRPEAGP